MVLQGPTPEEPANYPIGVYRTNERGKIAAARFGYQPSFDAIVLPIKSHIRLMALPYPVQALGATAADMNTNDIDLMHRVLDGEASPEERARFDTMLRSDAETRSTFEEIESALDEVNNLSVVDSPKGLSHRIMSSLPPEIAERRQARQRTPSFFKRIADVLRERKRPALALAYAFSIGLLAGIGLYSIMAPQPTAVTGTFASESAKSIEADGFEGLVRFVTEGDFLRVAIEAQAAIPADIVVRFGAGTELTRFEQTDASPSVRSTNRSITITADGHTEVDLTFRTSGQMNLEVEIARHGEMLERESFP